MTRKKSAPTAVPLATPRRSPPAKPAKPAALRRGETDGITASRRGETDGITASRRGETDGITAPRRGRPGREADGGAAARPEDALRRVNEVLLQLGPDYEQNVGWLTALCGEILGADCALYNRLDGDDLCAIGQWQPPPGFQPVDRADGHVCSDVIRHNRSAPTIIRDLPASGYSRSDPNVARFKLRTYIGCAVRRRDRAVGSLCAVFTRDVEIDDNAGQIMALIAAVLSVEEERRRAEEEIRSQEYQYRTTVDGLQDMMHVVGRDLRVVLANQAFRETMERRGLAANGVIGRDLFELQPFLPAGVRRQYETVFAEGRELITHDEIRIDGQLFHTETRKIPIQANGGTERIITLIHDVSRRVHDERVQTAVYRISEAAAGAPSLEELYRSIHAIVGGLMPARNFYIALRDSEREQLLFPYIVDQGSPPPEQRPLGRGRTEYVIRTGHPLLATPEVYRDLVSRRDIDPVANPALDWLGVPLKVDSRVIGAMVVQTYEENVRYGPAETEIMTYVSEQVAMAIQRKRAEFALRDNEERFRIAAEQTGQLIYDYDVSGGSIVWAGAIRQVTGFSPAEFARVDIAAWEEMIHPHDRQAVAAELQRAMAGRVGFDVSYRFRHHDGHYIHIEDRGIFIGDETGRTTRMIGTMNDISARVQSVRVQEAVYRISEAVASSPTLEGLFRSIHAIVGEMMPARNFYIALLDDASGQLSFPYFVDQFDSPPSPRPPGRGLTEYVLRSGRLLLSTPEKFASLQQQGEVERVGAPSLDWLGVPLKAGNRVIGAMVVQTYEEGVRLGPSETEIMTYVSEQVAMAIQRKRTEAELQDSEAQLRAIFERAGIGIVLTDVRRNVVLRWNPASRDMLGYSDSEMAGLTNPRITHPDDLERERPLWLEVQRGASSEYQLEKRYNRKDGRTIWVRQVSTFIRAADGSLLFGIDILEDITERLQLEEQFRQAQKMETVGRLAGGVAHDFNNLLGGIIGYADLLKENLTLEDSRRRYAQAILDTAERAAGLTRQLLTFSRKGTRSTGPVDVHQAVRDAVAILEHTLDRRIHIVTRLRADACMVTGDASQLQTALLNLCINARDAMPDGGTMTISTENVGSAEAVRGGLAAGGDDSCLRLTVEDTGTGMAGDVIEHIFEPFFTTKAAKGTGLGLSVVYATVREHNGNIQVQSEPGRGSRFDLLFPAHAPEPVAPAGEIRPSPRGSGCILLVDDEPVIREMGRDMLREMGYEVLLAEDGQAGLEVFRRERARISLVILDVIMPRLNGPDALLAMRRIDPQVRVIMSSGFSFDYGAQALLDDGAIGFVEKPYRYSELSAKIDAILKAK